MTPIEPRNLKGFRDFLPPQQIIRQKMMDSIRASYESFGFEPLETPALEYADILTGKYGDEGDKLMYRFKDNGDRDVALRYDLSIPLARVVAQYDNDIKKPWKRYQMSPVWRAENTQKGRFREFYQCDADIVGSTSPLADAEVLALASQTLQKLDIETKDFIIRVNGRGIIRDFYTKLGLSESEQISAMRAVDKVAKIGRDGVEKELAVHGFSADNIQSIVSFADTRITDITNTTLIEENFPEIQDSLGELINIVRYALKLAPNTNIVIDFSIARGLDYYTGMIFETYLLKATQFGSILSGGRFDELVGTFAKKSIPAVGLSVGLDRFISALEESDLITKPKTITDVLIVNFGKAFYLDYLKMAGELRNVGINTIVYFDEADIKKQLSFASEKGIKRVVLFGENEAQTGKVIVKDLEKGTQDTVNVTDLANSFTV